MIAQQTGPRSDRQTKPRRRPVALFFLALLAVIGAAIVAGVLPRLSRQKGLVAASEAIAERKPVVIVSPAHYAAGKDVIDLPGDLQPIIESPIFARADGYLRARLADIGDHVNKGQLLAEIETPELDQQIIQARASLAQVSASVKELEAEVTLTRANLGLSRVTRDRWQRLLERGAISRQDADEKQADFAVKEAQAQKAEATLATSRESIRASEANLRRLEELKSFARVLAPFKGVITARNVDVGTLINAGTKEMFRLAQVQPLRIFVNVPQTQVNGVRLGQSAELRVQERPGQVFPAVVTNVSHSLDSGSRAMLVILETPNPAAVLYPGMYTQVRFAAAARPAPSLRAPGDAVQMTAGGPQVAVMGPDHVIHFHSVTLGQDFGSEIEITSGLSEGDLVVSNPSDAVKENAAVEPREAAQPGGRAPR